VKISICARCTRTFQKPIDKEKQMIFLYAQNKRHIAGICLKMFRKDVEFVRNRNDLNKSDEIAKK
jgi:hypothetical protein